MWAAVCGTVVVLGPCWRVADVFTSTLASHAPSIKDSDWTFPVLNLEEREAKLLVGGPKHN